VIHHRSSPAEPPDRGYAFGERFADEIAANLGFYRRLFTAVGAASEAEVDRWGRRSLDVTRAWAPALADEIEGIAAGARQPPELMGALNARTEILGCCRWQAHECSVAVVLNPRGVDPIAVQTWDWHDDPDLRWLVWTIEHPSGHVVHTLTEFGIVGKIGLSDSGIGILLNILRHTDDGADIGTPVHVIARRVLDDAGDINDALLLIASASPSASSAMTLIAVQDGEKTALTAEVWPGGPSHVLPSPDGVLVHTNHFLDGRAAERDQEPVLGPDSLFRYEILRRRLGQLETASRQEVVDAMRSHLGSDGAVCCHPDPEARFGERYATLATVSLDVAQGLLSVQRGGPCIVDAARLELGMTLATLSSTQEAQ
jgi:isopenicillin-N N-acyltransferase-like protein